MKKVFKYGLIAGAAYLAYMFLTERKGTVTVGAIQQYPAAWDDYWDGQKASISDAQKSAIQKEIEKGNISFT